jgi:predicted transcriptional regulator of viral defense system
MKHTFLSLVQSKATVFSYIDLAPYFGTEQKKLIAKVGYYTARWLLYRIRRGLYARDTLYNPNELATKIQKPSYISLSTALQLYGIVFQKDTTIHCIGYKTIEILVDGYTIAYSTLHKKIRENFWGIHHEYGYPLASWERAVLDTLYLYGDFYFDNLRSVDWEIFHSLIPIYNSKVLTKRALRLANHYSQNE